MRIRYRHSSGAEFIASDDVDVNASRERLKLTQQRFARHYGLGIDAVRNWGYGCRKPDTAAQSDLRAISDDPAGVEAALWGCSDLTTP